MDQVFTPEFWQRQWAIVMDAPWVIIPLLLIAGLIGSRWQRSTDDGEIRGVKAENNALKEQLNLARKEQKAVTTQSIKLSSEVAELKVEFASIKASLLPAVVIPQLDKVASTTAVLSDTVTALSAANLSLGATLTGSGGLTVNATVAKATSKSE
jgi:hypothetical protein